MRMVVLRLQVEAEGGWEAGPEMTIDDGGGSGGGLGYWPAWHRGTILSTNG